MTKSPEIFVLATQYYVECQMPIVQISKRLNVSEKTLHNWKNEHDWQNKRNRFLKKMYSSNQTLYELLHLVSQKIIDDYKTDGTMPDQKTLRFIVTMVDKLPKLKMYENQEVLEKIQELNNKETKNKENKSEEVLSGIFKAMTE